MELYTYPLTRIFENKVLVVLLKHLYSPESIHASAYRFSGDYYILMTEKGDEFEVLFERKDGGFLQDSEVKSICNDFIDQQIRIDTEKQFGHIRDLIVEEAFRPVNSK